MNKIKRQRARERMLTLQSTDFGLILNSYYVAVSLLVIEKINKREISFQSTINFHVKMTISFGILNSEFPCGVI